MTTTTRKDIVSVDYIRLSTFDFKAYCDISAAMQRKYVGWRKSRWLQYTMQRSQENVSYGIAEQAGKPHGIFEASGADAHIFCHWFLETQHDYTDVVTASRIDLQSTKTKHDKLDYAKTFKRLAEPKKLILGSDGNTLYIGNRESDTFWRLYDKTPELVRLEIECKGNQAKRVWSGLKNRESPAAIYAYYLKRSRVPNYLAEYYATGHDPLSQDDLLLVVPIDLETKFLWLATLDQLVYKLANDHDFGDRTQSLIKRWSEYGQSLDKTQ